MNFLWCHWCWCQCHMMPTVSSVAPFHLVCQDDKMGGNMTFLAMWCHWHQHQYPVIPMAPLHLLSQDTQNEVQHWHWSLAAHDANGIKMAPFYSLGYENWNEVQHDLFCQVMPLTSTLVSHDTIGIGVSVMWCHCIDVSIMWCGQHHQWYHYIPKVKRIKIWCNMTFWVMWHHWHQPWHHVIPILFTMAPLHFLCQGNWNEVQQNFLVVWCLWYWHQWYILPMAWCLDTNAFLRLRQLIWGVTWLLGYVMPLVLASVSCYTKWCHQWNYCIP